MNKKPEQKPKKVRKTHKEWKKEKAAAMELRMMDHRYIRKRG